MSVQLLRAGNYIASQAYEHNIQGINDTHTALIQYDKGKRPSLSYVKFCPKNEYQLLAEVICYILANHLSIRQPRRAAIITIPLQMLRHSGIPIPDQYQTQDLALAWCTESLDSKSIKAIYKLDDYMINALKETFKLNPKMFSEWAAFDELVANTDRNAGNIIKLSKKVMAIIDHGLALLPAHLPHPDTQVTNKLTEYVGARLSTSDQIKLQSAMVHAANDHEEALNRGYNDIQSWMRNFGLDTTTQQRLNAFLKHRASENWLTDKLAMV